MIDYSEGYLNLKRMLRNQLVIQDDVSREG
jgi:hypothetical protein